MRRNVFIYGLSGSGKDTIANYLRDSYNYVKIRIAGTIKQYIFETYGFKTQEDFELAKRQLPNVRTAHNIFGATYDNDGLVNSNNEGTTNRINAIINKECLEFEIAKNLKDNPVCVVDCRNIDEVKKLIEAGYFGIFLSRTTNEFKNNKHKTEQDIFDNGILYDYLLKQKRLTTEDFCLVFNNENKDISIKQYNKFLEKFSDKTLIDKVKKITTDGSNFELDMAIDKIHNSCLIK